MRSAGGSQISEAYGRRTGGAGSYAKFSVFLKQKAHFAGRKQKKTYRHEADIGGLDVRCLGKTEVIGAQSERRD